MGDRHEEERRAASPHALLAGTTEQVAEDPRAGARVLVDASNLVVGGGVQVGASFVDELGRLASEGGAPPWVARVVVEVSREVAANLTRRVDALDLRVVNGRPFARLRRRPGPPQFDVCFTVFGPAYGPRRGTLALTGCADVTSLVPEHSLVVGARARARHGVRRAVSRRSFGSTETILVESPRVADDLVRRWAVPRSRIVTVPNVTHEVFRDPRGRHPVEVPAREGLTLAYPTRAYPHKNLAFLGRVMADAAVAGLDVRFVLTLDEAEWEGLDPLTREVGLNVGPLLVSQMPSLYEQVDGVFFPSMNECFSVTVLEAMSAGRPLIASDRPFVRDVAGPAAWYFDPHDPGSAAAALREAFTDPVEARSRVEAGRRAALDWPTARDRAESYVREIDFAVAEVVRRGSGGVPRPVGP